MTSFGLEFLLVIRSATLLLSGKRQTRSITGVLLALLLLPERRSGHADQLLIDEFSDAKVGEFTAIARAFDSAEWNSCAVDCTSKGLWANEAEGNR